MKAGIQYTVIAIFSAVTTCIYGFAVGGEVSAFFCTFQFCVAFILFALFSKKESKKPIRNKIFKTVLISVISVLFSVFLYVSVNQISSTHVATYEAVVISHIRERGGGSTIWFIDPYGNEKYIDIPATLKDFRIFIPDDEPQIEAGNTIQVKELQGLFKLNYCVLINSDT